MNTILKYCIVVSMTLPSASIPALAATVPATIEAQLEAIQKVLNAQQAQLAAQQLQIEAQRVEIEALRAKQPSVIAKPDPTVAQHEATIENRARYVAQSETAPEDQAKLSFLGNRPTITTVDGRSSIALRALVQMDTAHYNQGTAGSLGSDYRRGSVGATANRESDAARDLSDGAYLRRARFGVEGSIAGTFKYRLITEYGGSGTEGPTRINDAWIAYTGLAPFSLQIGAFAPPANLEDGTPPDDLLFIERASSSELSRTLGGGDGRYGLGLRAGGVRWMGALTLTSRTVNDPEVFDSQSALVARFGGLVAIGSAFNVHLGANGTYIIHPPDQGPPSASNRFGIRFRDRPELRVDSTRLIDTGAIDADHAYAVGVEFAANWRNWLLQGEDTWYGVQRHASILSNPRFNGYYVEASWVLTGESHRYNPDTGSYRAPRPLIPFDGRGGWGAWELALRYSRTDLNFRPGLAALAAPSDGVRGGEQSIAAAGINWYPNPNLRFLFDYLHVNVNRLNPAGPGNLTPFGATPATPPFGVNVGQSLNVYALRSQYSF